MNDSPSEDARGTAGPAQALRVLVVDDDAAIRTLRCCAPETARDDSFASRPRAMRR